jgi:hypothetical protein
MLPLLCDFELTVEGERNANSIRGVASTRSRGVSSETRIAVLSLPRDIGGLRTQVGEGGGLSGAIAQLLQSPRQLCKATHKEDFDRPALCAGEDRRGSTLVPGYSIG